MSTFALNLAFAAVLAVTSMAGLALALVPRRAVGAPVGAAGSRRGRVPAVVVTAAVLLMLVWGVSVAYMTLRTGTGLGVRLNLLPLLFDGRGSAVDAVLNVFVFVPLGLLAAAAGIRFRALLPGALAVTLSIEIAQYVMDVGRTADVNDLITNTAGACLGWAVAALVLRARRPAAPRRALASAG
uniref:VanZ family protein n=1 Tax=Herbiconiux sp. TaxID=1871186 RepID=UPI0025C2B403